METSSDTLTRAIALELPMLQREYQRGINRDLSTHRWQGVLERRVVELVERYLERCSSVLQDNPISSAQSITAADGAALRKSLGEFKDALIAHALKFNSSSCALSNFGEEHVPGAEYLASILTQVETRWSRWCDSHGLAADT